MAMNEIPSRVRWLAAEAAPTIRKTLGREARVFWFGSWVRGTASPRSDLDLAVDAGAALPLADLARLEERLEALPTLQAWDLLDLHQVGEARRQGILTEGVEL